MPSLKTTLDRGLAGFEPTLDAFDRTMGLVGRRRRKQRIITIAAALVLAVVAIAEVVVIFGDETGRPAEPSTGWPQRFVTEGHDGSAPIAADASGVYALSATLIRPQTQDSDVVLTRYDANGGLIWRRTFGTERVDMGKAIALSDDAVYVGITSYVGGHVSILRFDKDGSEVWRYAIDRPRGDPTLAVFSDGLYVSINSEGDNILSKLDFDGNELWTRHLPEYVGSLAADVTGVYLARTHYTGPGITDAILQKFDPDGNDLWSVTLEGPSDDEFGDLVVSGDVVYAVGTTGSAVFVSSYRPDGTELWSKTVHGASFGIDYPAGGAAADGNGVYIAVFERREEPDGNRSEVAVVRAYDVEGRLRWDAPLTPGRVEGEAAIDIAVHDDGAYVSWEQGDHAGPAETDWTAFLERLSISTTDGDR